MRCVVSRGVVCRLAEGNWQKSKLCCFSDDRGRVLSEEERAKETVYIQVNFNIVLIFSCVDNNCRLVFVWSEENGEGADGETEEEEGGARES